MKEILRWPAAELAQKINRREIKAKEAVSAYLEQLYALEPELNSFITVDEEGAYAQAGRIDELTQSGRNAGPLAGVPVAVKDNLCTRGLRTTCASRMLEDFVPFYEAGAVERLRAAGAIILGKTNMDEFAMGSTSETSAFGPVKNPWDISRVPGGSSGGSCCAVAAAQSLCALGSDTGGSIRQPASYCGVVGLKPTYGTVSRWGLVAYASSLDQIGPIARNVEDCALLLEVISGGDKRDSTCLDRRDADFGRAFARTSAFPQTFPQTSSQTSLQACPEDVRGLRIGIVRDYFDEGLDGEVAAAVRRAAQQLRDQGALVEEVDLSLVSYAIPAYYTIACAEASSNLARFDGVKYGYRAGAEKGLHPMYRRTRTEGFGTEVKRRIVLGSFVLSSGYYEAYYEKALRVKAMIVAAFDKAFSRFDLLLGPVAPTTAPLLGQTGDDPLKMYLGDIYTVSVNLAGLPAISLPCGLDSRGLPIGVQLVGPRFGEKTILQAARAYEKACGGFALSPMAERAEKKGGMKV